MFDLPTIVAIYAEVFFSNSWFEVEGLRGLPSEVWVLAAEMTERSCLLVNGSLQVELLDDVARSEVEVFPYNSHDVLISATVFSRSVGVDMDREGIGEADSVRDLEESSVAEASSDQGLGHVAGVVGCGSVDLGRVFTGESTTTVGSPATVGVDDNLTASEAGVSSGTTNVELARGVNHDLSAIQHVLGDHGLDDLLSEDILDRLVGHIGVVLS